MGRIVLGEKVTCEPVLEKLYSLPVNEEKSGLLIGRLGDETVQKDHVVHLALTPDDDEADSGQNASKMSWISAHAKQVNRMLPGGLHIIGLVMACPLGNYNLMKPDVQKLLTQIEKISGRSTLNMDKVNCHQEYLVLHICTKTKKLSCQSVNLGDKSASFRPAEWKVQQFLQQWSKLHTMCNVDHPYLTTIPEGKQQAYLKIQSGLSSVITSIIESHATINGDILDESVSVSSLLGNQSAGKAKRSALSPGGNFCVELYLTRTVFENTNNAESYQNYVSYSGCIQGVAFIPSKSTVKDALHALKIDVIRSIVGRFRILYEDVLESSDEPLAGCLLPPKRVVTGNESQTYTDYIFEAETNQDVNTRLQEILGITNIDEKVDSQESFPVSNLLETISMPKSRPVPSALVQEITGGGITVKTAAGLIVAGAAALASILLGWMVME